MVAIAERLAGDIDHLRVDLYAVGDDIVFGDLTPYDDSGFAYPFVEDTRYETLPPRDLDYEYGQKWKLPKMSIVAKVRHVLVD